MNCIWHARGPCHSRKTCCGQPWTDVVTPGLGWCTRCCLRSRSAANGSPPISVSVLCSAIPSVQFRMKFSHERSWLPLIRETETRDRRRCNFTWNYVIPIRVEDDYSSYRRNANKRLSVYIILEFAHRHASASWRSHRYAYVVCIGIPGVLLHLRQSDSHHLTLLPFSISRD